MAFLTAIQATRLGYLNFYYVLLAVFLGAQAVDWSLYLAGRKQEAIEAVPDEYCDEGALVGPVERITERYRAWEEAGVTGLTVTTSQPDGIELMAKLAGTGV